MPSAETLDQIRPEASAVASKHSRNRPKASCGSCYRRKQRCDRKWPCSHCLDRKVGHTCHYSTHNNAAERTAKATAASKANLQAQQQQQKQNPENVKASKKDNAADDRSLCEQSTTGPSSPFDSPTSSSTPLNLEEKSLNDLGYLDHNKDNLLGYLKHMQIVDDGGEDTDPTMTGTDAFTINAEIAKLLKRMPPRPVTGVLVQHFFSEANWIYEMVCPTTFTERYNEWWARPCQSVDDVQFATLLLRLCSYTAQFLPSQNYMADTILGNPLSALREQCNATAIALTRVPIMKGGLPSITRIHEHFFHSCYLKNEGQMKESWDVLGKAVHEAHELGLHLESRKPSGRLVSEYDIEMGKRTYWNLWLWDKFMSIVLGRWPLIPEQRCTVSLPQNVIDPSAVPHGDAPDIFCERRLQIDLAQIASNVLSQNREKACTEPATIDKQMAILKVDLIEKLPPAFRLEDPEEKWDEQLPHLSRQRQMFRISVFAAICMLLRPMIIVPAKAVRAMSASDRKLVVKHRMSLIEAAIQMLDSVARLHTLMGGKHHRFFLLSFFTLEPAVLLGIYLMTPRFGVKESRQGFSALKSSRGIAAKERDMWKHGLQEMEEAVARLSMLSEVSSIARTGLKVLEKMLVTINNTEMARSLREDETVSVSSSSKSRSPNSNASHSRASTHSQPSSSLPNCAGGSSISSIPGLHSADEAFGNPITPTFPYDYAQIQDSAPQVHNTHNYDIQDQYNVCDNTMDWDLDLNNGNITSNSFFLNDAATIPWPDFTAQTAAADASLMDANHFASDIATNHNFEWSWMGSNAQQTAWFGA